MTSGEENAMAVDRKTALAIAHDDARRQYRDLSIYDVSIERSGRNWKIDYTLRDRRFQGGGPHYLISGDTGEIVFRRYEQ